MCCQQGRARKDLVKFSFGDAIKTKPNVVEVPDDLYGFPIYYSINSFVSIGTTI